MKNMFESAETFEAYAMIDLNYYMLKDIHDRNSKPVPPIVQMVNDATGWQKEQNETNVKDTVHCLREIIRLKKQIEADYSGDEESLNKILELDWVKSILKEETINK